MAGRRGPPATSQSSVPQIMAIGVVLALVAAATTLYLLGGQKRAGEPEPEVELEQADPFEGLPPEEPPARKAPAESADGEKSPFTED